jgi:hypothetical protein
VQGGKAVYSSDLTVQVGGEPVRVRVEPGAVAKIPRTGAPEPNAGGPRPGPDGFVPLFNGKDLAGWEVFGGGTGNWRVVDGAIVGSGPLSHLFSERGDYKNFHLRVEAMINDGGNSGQYFRALFRPGFPTGYEAQINATHRDPIKTGSLYFPAIPGVLVKEQLHKPNEWFTQEVIADADHIVIKVNGKTTVDWKDPADTYTSGHFALQQHDPGTVVRFRKIEVKERPPAKPEGQGFVPLFNGKDLAGWQTHPGQPGDWKVEDGVLVGRGPGKSHLFSDRADFADFHLRTRVRVNAGGNSGVYFRTGFGEAAPGRVSPAGYEAQIFPTGKPSDPKTGSLMNRGKVGVVVTTAPVGANEWFTLEVIARGSRLRVLVNGKETANTSDPDFTRGRIALQVWDGGPDVTRVEFASIEVKDLTGSEP